MKMVWLLYFEYQVIRFWDVGFKRTSWKHLCLWGLEFWLIKLFWVGSLLTVRPWILGGWLPSFWFYSSFCAFSSCWSNLYLGFNQVGVEEIWFSQVGQTKFQCWSLLCLVIQVVHHFQNFMVPWILHLNPFWYKQSVSLRSVQVS